MLTALLTYSAACGTIMALLYGVYYLTLRRTTLFAFNRRILLTILLFSGLVPLMTQFGGVTHAISRAGIPLPEFEVTLTANYQSQPGSTSLTDILATVYAAGLALTAIWAATNIVFIVYLSLTSRRATIMGTDVLIHNHNRLSPFSWGGRIFIPKNMLGDCEKELRLMLAHEAAHRNRRHWLDLLAANIMAVINWYNPCSWMMLRELINLHEYEADRDTVGSCNEPIEYQLLLIKKTAGSRFHAFADSLNHSSLKNRITMMMKNQTKSPARLRALAMLPIMAAALCVTNVSCVRDAADKSAGTEVPAESACAVEEAVGIVEIPADLPEFEGGMEKLYRLLAENIHYPEDAMENGIDGKVVVRITVGTDGEIMDPEVIKSVYPSLDKEAVRAILKIKENGGRFKPATDEAGNPVETTYVLPVSFKLQ